MTTPVIDEEYLDLSILEEDRCDLTSEAAKPYSDEVEVLETVEDNEVEVLEAVEDNHEIHGLLEGGGSGPEHQAPPSGASGSGHQVLPPAETAKSTFQYKQLKIITLKTDFFCLF